MKRKAHRRQHDNGHMISRRKKRRQLDAPELPPDVVAFCNKPGRLAFASHNQLQPMPRPAA